MAPEEYIEQRLNDQIGWYDRKSATNQRWFKRLRFAEIVAAAHNSIPLPLRRQLVSNQNCDRCVGRFVLFLIHVHLLH
jgi:hypothetical protein